MKFHAWVTSVGETGKKIKKERPYISRISPGAPLRPILTNFGLRVRLVDVINCAKFYRNRLRGLKWVSSELIQWVAAQVHETISSIVLILPRKSDKIG